MLTISKPLSASQARTYHQEEFGNARDNYYTSAPQIRGAWHGQLARDWGLAGEVHEQHFQRLAEGQDPCTGDPLVRHRAVCTYTNDRGRPVKTMAHRAGWDATFSAPKTVSLTALVGGDTRVRDAHRESVAVALDELEHYVQARLGDHPAQATGQWIAAQFEHDSARPVDGYAAPQLHTHVVVFNLTRTEDGDIRPLQPRELYKSQAYVTAVYRAELATRLKALGYAIDRGASEQPEIRGYTQEYVDASSPRRQQIQDQLAKGHHRGAEAAEIAAHQTREAKRDRSHEEMQRRHRDMAEAFGHQPAHVVHAAYERASVLRHQPPHLTAHAAVTFAEERNLEREAVVDERTLLRDALNRSMGEVTLRDLKAEVEQRLATGAFVAVDQQPGAPGRAVTTREMIALEQDTIEIMHTGQHDCPALVRVDTRRAITQANPQLSEQQRAAIEEIFASRDRMLALEGVAGAGKTTALKAVRDAAEREGYQVEGFAPTSRAAQHLREAGIASSTLQRFVAARESPREEAPRLYVLDESSLASTTQLNAFLHRLTPFDRVLLVGDVRQHQAVDAGRPYQQLQEAGMETARLDAIVRQKDPALRAVVEQLSRGDVSGAIHQLDTQGRVHEIANHDERLRAIAREYVKHPEGTLVVSADNHSRAELNQVIHRAMQATGEVGRREHHVRVLVTRQEVTGADRQWAEQYRPGDVVRYTKGSRAGGG